MSFKRFNAVQCGFNISCFCKSTLIPQLKNKMPVGIKETIFIPSVSIPKIKSDFRFSFLDYRHWYYNDDVFEQYLNRVLSFKPEYLFIFDKPFDHERPWKIDTPTFEKKMIYRAERIKSFFKNNSPETQLVSPFIFSVHDLYLKAYSNFLALTHHLYDYYSVFCSNDMSDMSIGRINSLLKEILNHSDKPIIVFVAIPCGKNKNSEDYSPFNEKVATEKLVQLINLFNSISQNCYYFYFGIDKDVYDENKKPSPFDFWNNEMPLDTYIMEYKWDWHSFLGLTDSRGKVKIGLMKTILDIAEKLNVG